MDVLNCRHFISRMSLQSITAVNLLLAISLFGFLTSTVSADELAEPGSAGQLSEADFRDPSSAARPRVWWHWMNGNVTLEGIKDDLAWMERIGIGGLQYFDASLDTPQVVADRTVFGTETWRTAMRAAVTRARAAGLEFGIASSPGFSETGGPWVKPEAAMKKLVWSELDIEGGRYFTGRLPTPPSITGPFQDIPVRQSVGSANHASETLPRLYGDVAVVAYRIPGGEDHAVPTITASSPIDVARLGDGDRTQAVSLTIPEDGEGWVLFSYERPHVVRAIELVLQGAPPLGPIEPSWPVGRLEISDDGKNFRTIVNLPERGAPQQTLAIPKTMARYFRLVLEPRFAPFPVAMFDRKIPVSKHQLMEVRLLSDARIHRFEDKAGWSNVTIRSATPLASVGAEAVIDTGEVIDLSERLQSDGTINWLPPKGRWRILRLGWSLTGKLVHPASPEATGLEVDKLNREHVGGYLEEYLRFFRDAVGEDGLGKGGIAYMLNDSYEAGAANWTDDMLDEFEQRRGYDPRHWLPALTGAVVESTDKSEKFLWDYRRTLADLIADEHYGEISRRLKARGMGRYSEAHEAPRAFVGDGMEVKKSADVPMGAYWAHPQSATWIPDLLESASVAHLYGQNLVAAESFTAITPPYTFAPEHLKPFADKMMINGVNRFVIHASVHQPRDGPGPGLGLGAVGQYFSRNETWADMAGPWVNYLARSSELLQKGRFVADIAWFYGEDENITSLFAQSQPAVPAGFRYDFVNADAVRNLLRGENAALTVPAGAQYRILVIDPAVRWMTTETLRAILTLAEAGVPIVGERPVGTPSLADDPEEFASLADELWSGTHNTYATLEAAIVAIELSPDVDLGIGVDVQFVHRKLDDADIYFVANLGDRALTLEPSFRVAGRAAEFWRAEDGSICPASYRSELGRTRVPITLMQGDAVFVVFRETAAPTPAVRELDKPRLLSRHTMDSAWHVRFPKGYGAPESVELTELRSLSEHPHQGIRYFSGIATYSTTFELPHEYLQRGSLILDLGTVRNIAEVRLNGQPVGTAWRAPFQVDITEQGRPGTNRLEIRVANLWPNRLIGDQQPGVEQPVAFALYNPYDADSELLEAGLLGPVEILQFAPGSCAP